MMTNSVDCEVSFTVENDVIVDDDFPLEIHALRSVAIERVRSAAFSDGVKDTLLGARKLPTTRARRLTAAHDAERQHADESE
jgi:hypothetical protein